MLHIETQCFLLLNVLRTQKKHKLMDDCSKYSYTNILHIHLMHMLHFPDGLAQFIPHAFCFCPHIPQR